MIGNYTSCMFHSSYTASITIDNNFLKMPAYTKMSVSSKMVYAGSRLAIAEGIYSIVLVCKL